MPLLKTYLLIFFLPLLWCLAVKGFHSWVHNRLKQARMFNGGLSFEDMSYHYDSTGQLRRWIMYLGTILLSGIFLHFFLLVLPELWRQQPGLWLLLIKFAGCACLVMLARAFRKRGERIRHGLRQHRWTFAEPEALRDCARAGNGSGGPILAGWPR